MMDVPFGFIGGVPVCKHGQTIATCPACRVARDEGVSTVLVRCVGCKAERVIKAGEIPRNDIPTCEQCFSLMLPVRASATFKRGLG